MWDSAVLAFDDAIGSPDSMLTIRITGCWRNGCVIGTPSKLTVTIVDNDGGLAASPPGPPDPPRLVCAATDDGYDPTGVAVNWKAPSFLGGGAVEDYNLSYRRLISTNDDRRVWDAWQFWPHTGAETSATITGLDPDSLYEVIVQAVNANGEGPWSPNDVSFWTGYSVETCRLIDQSTPHR